MKFIYTFFTLVLLVINTNLSFAHPHVFIESYLEIRLNKTGLMGFQLKWEFDEMLSSGVILDYDVNGDGKFSKKETERVKEEVFSYLKNYSYFTELEVNGKRYDITEIQNFKPQILKGKLVYNFFIPCHVEATPTLQTIKVNVYDKEYFSHINMTEKQIQLSSPGAINAQLMVYKNPEKSYYFDNLTPFEAKIELIAP